MMFAMFSLVSMAQEITIRHNVNFNGQSALNLQCNYSISGSGYVNAIAYICDGEGEGVPCEINGYHDSEGNLCSYVTKSYVNAGNVKANLYIPNSVMGECCEPGVWYVFFVVSDYNTNERLYESEMYEFQLDY